MATYSACILTNSRFSLKILFSVSLLILSSKITIPAYPVPFNLQTLTLFLLPLLYNTKVSLFYSDKEFLKLLDNYNNNHFKVDVLEDNITCYYNSSGTTGNSKYIKYSHKNMLFMIESVVETFGFDSNSRHLGILPFSFTSITNYSFLPTIFSGGYLLLSDNFMSIRPKFWDIIHEYKINYVQIVPTIAFTMISSKILYSPGIKFTNFF